jgi:hypothetical protein
MKAWPSGEKPEVAPGSGWRKIRTKVRPAFSITRREATFAAIASAVTRWTPNSVKPLRISARDPSVA